MDLCQLEAITEKQEQIISELEQELFDLLSEQEKVAGAENMDKMRKKMRLTMLFFCRTRG